MPVFKVLIVDDDASILILLEKRLQNEGYQVIKAASGQEAVDKAKSFMPHLIIMDIMLPDIDGAEAFQRINADNETSHIPVVFLSGIVGAGEGRSEINVKERNYPAVGKPIDFNVLLGLVKESLPG